MNVSGISVVITVFIWYFLIGVFNLAYLGATKRLNDLNWVKFILQTLGLVAVYFAVNAISIIVFGGVDMAITLFIVLNTLILLCGTLVYAKFVLRLEENGYIYYGLIFTLIFNLGWYRLFGML